MGNHTTRHSFSVVFPCVHTFSVDLNSFCFPPLCLPSPADSWRHGYHLIPCPAGTELSLTPVIWRVMWVFRKTTGHVQRGQGWLSFLSSAPSLCQRVTSLWLKIESRPITRLFHPQHCQHKGKNSCVAPTCCQELMRADRWRLTCPLPRQPLIKHFITFEKGGVVLSQSRAWHVNKVDRVVHQQLGFV